MKYLKSEQVTFEELIATGSTELLISLMEGGGKAFRDRLHMLLMEAIRREKDNGFKTK